MQRFEFNGISFARNEKYIFSDYQDTGYVIRQKGSYVGQDGADILSSNYEPRTFTLNGHIVASSNTELYTLRQKLVKACDGKTKSLFKYIRDERTFFSEAIADLPQLGLKRGFAIPFTITFNLYNFYWKDGYKRVENVFRRTNNLKGTFTFPLALTVRTNKATLINSGDVECPLIIRITWIGESEGTGGFKIINHTTGDFIQLNHSATNGETVTIDTQELTIISSIYGNILHKITNDSTLGMKLALGPNKIEGINYANNEIIIKAEHHSMFVGV